ncbi:Cytochrome b-c1 complex subunit 8 [Halotydeus destructor]|nr:Cytochrome b-c1 complex subunit 8 [Halotydeus destructor]
MGKAWGHLAYIRNLVIVRLSPFEQRVSANLVQNGMRGFKRDFMANAPYILLPVMVAYMTIDYGRRENEKFSRKNPSDYENDV